MDLEELNDNILTNLEELKTQITKLQSNMPSSKNSNELTLIFSKLNDFEKNSNENLKKNADEMSRNARSVYSELSNNANSKLNELKESVSQSKSELKQIGTSATSEIESAVRKAVGRSLADINAASQKLEVKTRRNLFYSAGLTLLLLFVALGGILFAWKWHDGTKIAEMRIEKMLEAEKEDIRKKAVSDYKASDEFREDACKEVAENIQMLDTLHYLNKYIKSSTVNEYTALKNFYKDFLKPADEDYKESQK